MQYDFSALWDFEKEIRSGQMTIKEAQETCKKFAAMKAKALRELGFKVSRSTLRNQLRPYWGLCNPCGMSCTVYYVTCST